MKNDFISRLSRSSRELFDKTPAKLKLCGLALIVMVFSELWVNNQAIAQLVDASGDSASGVLRSMVIALFLTVLIIVLGVFSGDRAKRYYFQATDKRCDSPDKSLLVVAIASSVANLVLIATISYIRFSVTGDASAVDSLAAQASQSLSLEATGSSSGTGEVILLAAILLASAIFSFIYSFTVTDPFQETINADIKRTETVIKTSLAENASGRSQEFAEDSLVLCDHIANSVRQRAQDQIIISLLSFCSDPAIATRVYEKAVEELSPNGADKKPASSI